MLGALIGAASQVAGSLLNKPSNPGAAARNAQTRANAVARQNRIAQKKVDDRNWARQQTVNRENRQYATQASQTDYLRNKEFARNKVQWLVEDAKAAGISPLAALGIQSGGGGFASSISPAQTYYDSPASQAPSASDLGGLPPSGSAVGDGVAAAGAMLADHLANAERRGLQNQLLRAQIGNVNANTAATLSAATSRTGIASSQQENTSYRMFGVDIEPSNLFTDVQTGSQRLGEPFEWAAFLPTFLADYSANYGKLKAAANQYLDARAPRNKFGTRQFFKN